MVSVQQSQNVHDLGPWVDLDNQGHRMAYYDFHMYSSKFGEISEMVMAQ